MEKKLLLELEIHYSSIACCNCWFGSSSKAALVKDLSSFTAFLDLVPKPPIGKNRMLLVNVFVGLRGLTLELPTMSSVAALVSVCTILADYFRDYQSRFLFFSIETIVRGC